MIRSFQKTEEGKSACDEDDEEESEEEKKKKKKKNAKSSLDANYKLFEMGFEDFDLNAKLLTECNNNLSKVIENLIEISKKKNRLLPDYF